MKQNSASDTTSKQSGTNTLSTIDEAEDRADFDDDIPVEGTIVDNTDRDL